MLLTENVYKNSLGQRKQMSTPALLYEEGNVMVYVHVA